MVEDSSITPGRSLWVVEKTKVHAEMAGSAQCVSTQQEDPAVRYIHKRQNLASTWRMELEAVRVWDSGSRNVNEVSRLNK